MEIEKVRGCIFKLLHSFIPPPLETAAPPPDLPQLLTLVLSHLQPEEAKTSSTHILKAAVKEIIQKAFNTFQADLKVEGVTKTLSCDQLSCWAVCNRLLSTSSSAHILFALHQFSQTLSNLLSTCLRAAPPPHTSLLATVQEAWKALEQDFIQLVLGVELDFDPEWSRCLGMLGACLVVSEVNKTVSKCTQENEESLDGGGVSSLLESLNQCFPSAVFKMYLILEQQEVGGASKPISTLQGGLILKVR